MLGFQELSDRCRRLEEACLLGKDWRSRLEEARACSRETLAILRAA
jgi:hypothetical protein